MHTTIHNSACDEQTVTVPFFSKLNPRFFWFRQVQPLSRAAVLFARKR
jgi:hypothetical protein